MINKSFLKNRRILITGGTGSFGNAMTKALLSKNIKEIRIFSRDEKKQDDMRRFYNNNKIKFYIGDIRDSESVKNAVKNIDYIFHAAALKQVPSCEFYPMEAVKTNIVGVENILNHAIDSNVKKIVCLSTDKAVYPINAMGLSKAMMEKIIIAKSRFLNSKKTKLCITRYGNVIYSRGSVIPLFVDCIVNNKPLPVTDLSMTRFMMSLEDAINLVFFAFSNGNNGDILIRKSPASTIETIIDALSKILNKKITKKIIGPRHGEKYHETLMTKDERQTSKNFRDYFQISTDNRELNYEKYFSKGKKDFKEYNDYTSANTKILNLKETINLLKPILKQNKI
jgi:UDP-glucose 4-epimerase